MIDQRTEIPAGDGHVTNFSPDPGCDYPVFRSGADAPRRHWRRLQPLFRRPMQS